MAHKENNKFKISGQFDKEQVPKLGKSEESWDWVSLVEVGFNLVKLRLLSIEFHWHDMLGSLQTATMALFMFSG